MRDIILDVFNTTDTGAVLVPAFLESPKEKQPLPVPHRVADRGTATRKERRKGGGGEHDRAVCSSPPFRNQSVHRLSVLVAPVSHSTTNERPGHCVTKAKVH